VEEFRIFDPDAVGVPTQLDVNPAAENLGLAVKLGEKFRPTALADQTEPRLDFRPAKEV